MRCGVYGQELMNVRNVSDFMSPFVRAGTHAQQSLIIVMIVRHEDED